MTVFKGGLLCTAAAAAAAAAAPQLLYTRPPTDIDIDILGVTMRDW